jgi:hypothetical protein
MNLVDSFRSGLVRWLAAALCGLVGAGASAETPPDRVKQLEQRLERSMQQIELLTARVAELERAGRVASAAPAPSAPPAPAPAKPVADEQARSIAALQESINQIADGLGKSAIDSGIPVHGFLDVGAGWSSSADPVRLRGFNAGSLDLYLTPQIGSRVKSLIELVVEFDEDGKSSIDMERGQIGYTFSDELTLWGGRFHTPFGLWNTSFHHGANLQPSISRPTFVEFEDRGGLIPAHSVGLWANGKAELDAGKITYDLFLANGPSIRGRTLTLDPFTDDNHEKMSGFNLGFRPSGPRGGLSLGLHGFRSSTGTYSADGTLRHTTRLRALGGYLGYDARDWEVIGEYYRFNDVADDGGGGRTSHAGFLHLGRTFGAFTPFLRYERASIDPADDYFRSLQRGRSSTHLVLGARYAFDANSSLKLELRKSREAAARQVDANGNLVDLPDVGYHRALIQYSIAF